MFRLVLAFVQTTTKLFKLFFIHVSTNIFVEASCVEEVTVRLVLD